MASPIISSSPFRYSISLLSFLIILILLCTSNTKCFALKHKLTPISQHTHTVQLSSLLPASVCSHSSVPDSEATLKVVHKHGPCSSHKSDQTNTDHAHLLQQDKARVSFIHSRHASGSSAAVISGQLDGATTLPAKSGAVVGSGNYIVTVGIGSPKSDLSLIFDTGSDVTWTQCKPCAKSCYSQKETIFDPSKSTSYANVSCTSTECSYLKSATGITPGCSSVTSTCIYGIQYGDQSFSVGYFGRDTLTLTQKDVLTGYLFGCGQNNQGLFGGSAGLLGLGRNKVSFVQQTASKYNRQFSYCLPASSSSTGYLSFGGSPSSSVRYTPITTLSSTTASFYSVDILWITVGGKKLAAATAALFKGSGTIVDSGTVITRLPPTAYAALSAEFKRQMAGYPAAPALSLLDTCFDLSKYDSVTVPKVVFLLGGKAPVNLAAQGILYASSTSQVCLAFAANSDDSDVAIFGNVQQRTLKVVYDVGGGRIGFGSAGCS